MDVIYEYALGDFRQNNVIREDPRRPTSLSVSLSLVLFLIYSIIYS